MPEETKETFGADKAGCWFDGHRGIYIGEEVIAVAVEHGWNPADAGYDDDDLKPGSEWYCDAWDSAENYLSEFAEEGYYFGSNEGGDWGLWQCPDEEEEEEA